VGESTLPAQPPAAGDVVAVGAAVGKDSSGVVVGVVEVVVVIVVVAVVGTGVGAGVGAGVCTGLASTQHRAGQLVRTVSPIGPAFSQSP
jgi:hypothetical protein